MHVKVVTKLSWPSFRNVATEICKQLSPACVCTCHDSSNVEPGGKIIYVGTLDTRTLKFIKTLSEKSNVLFYATTEGLSRLNGSDLQLVESMNVVAVSTFVRQMLEAVGVPVAAVLHHGIDMKDTDTDADFYGKLETWLKGRRIVLVVAANHLRKGLDRLLKAYKVVENNIPNAFLILHSQPKGYYDLAAMAKSLDLRNLWLTNEFGRVTQRRLNALYQLCSFYVQPSLSEGFGLPILEAYRFNKPAIAVNAPPFNEIIKNEETGLLVPLKKASWSAPGELIDFKIHTYTPNDLADSMMNLMLDHHLLSTLRCGIASDKWNWDANMLYPQLLTYFE